ncbi:MULTISPECIES: hypothetical protein [Aminobacterium]|jgi:hypothetical protein|nr:hypothetical protein [Aminobacterium sp. UBA4987]
MKEDVTEKRPVTSLGQKIINIDEREIRNHLEHIVERAWKTR